MRWIYFGLALLLCSSVTAEDQCVDAGTSPMHSGDFWKYLVNGLNFETHTVTDEIFQSPTPWGEFRVIRVDGWEADGSKVFSRKNESGVETFGITMPDLFMDGVGFVDTEMYFEPPWLLPRVACVGDRITQSGAAVYIIIEGEDRYQFDGTYDVMVRILALERISVLYGSYDSWKLQTLLEAEFDVGGELVEITTTETQWVVPGIGTVRSLVTEDGGRVVTRELYDTNQIPVPEPSGNVAALVLLALLAAARERRGGAP